MTITMMARWDRAVFLQGGKVKSVSVGSVYFFVCATLNNQGGTGDPRSIAMGVSGTDSRT